MPAIFSFLVTFPAQLFGLFLALFGRKFAVGTATVLAMMATTVAMLFCMKTIITSAVALIAMPSWLATIIAWFIPSNAIGMLSLIVSGRICKAAYRLTMRKINLVAQAN